MSLLASYSTRRFATCYSPANVLLSNYIHHQRYSTAEQTKQAYLDKYADKLRKKMEEEKVSSIEELKKKVEKSQKDKEDQEIQSLLQTLKVNSPLNSKSASSKQAPVVGLEDIMDLEKIQTINKDLILKMWAEYHTQKDVYVSGGIDSQVYQKFKERSSECRRFVLPLPLDQGYEMHYLEATNKQVAFVPLLEFQLHNENAPPCFLLDFYTELESTKGLVLFRGMIEPKRLTMDKGKFLASQFLNFFVGSDEKFKLVEKFNKTPAHFDIQEVIQSLNQL